MEDEPIIPLFPLLEEKKDIGKLKENTETSRQEEEEFQEAVLPDALLPPLEVKRQVG